MTEPPPAPPSGQPSQAWAPDARTIAIVVGLFLALLALLALAATASRSSDESNERDLSEEARSQLRNRDVDIRPMPGCPGGFSINDRVFVVPDPEACGLELVPGQPDVNAFGDIYLVPSPDGNIGGFRFDEFGDLELLPPGQVRPDDFFLERAPDGSFRLSWPDGDGYQISPGDDGLSFRQRQGEEFGDLDGDNLPDFEADDFPQFLDPDRFDDFGNDDDGTGWGFPNLVPLLIVLAIAAVLLAAYLLLRGRDWSGEDDEVAAEEPPPEPVSYAAEISALDRMLWEIDQESDPRLAIQRVYAALETGLGNADMARQIHETPGLYLHRILGRVDSLHAPLQRLTNLFEQARFSDHDITQDMRNQAVEILVGVRNDYAAAAIAQPPAPEPALPS